VQSQRLLQFLSLVSNPMDSQLVDRGKLLRDIAQSMDIDPEEIIKSQEQLIAEQQAALQQQQMLAAASAGDQGLGLDGGMAPPDGAVGI
jgi:cytidylate kinase